MSRAKAVSWKHFSSVAFYGERNRIVLAVDFEAGRGFRWCVREAGTHRELEVGHSKTWGQAADAAVDAADRLCGSGSEGASYAA